MTKRNEAIAARDTSDVAVTSDVATLHAATKAKRATKLARDAAKRDDTSATTKRATTKRAAKRDDNATFTLATLARELGISPKIVRAKARRNAAMLKRDFTSPAKHVYFERDRAAITAFVMRDRKPA